MSIICDLKCVAFQFFKTIFLKHIKVSVEFSIEALAICLLLNAAFVKIRFYNTIQYNFICIAHLKQLTLTKVLNKTAKTNKTNNNIHKTHISRYIKSYREKIC